MVKNLLANAGDTGSIFSPGRSQLSLGASYSACVLEPGATFCNKRSHLNEKSAHSN